MTNKIDKFRGILGKAKEVSQEVLDYVNNLSRTTKAKVALSLFFGGLALKGSSQVDTNWPANSLNSLEGVVVVPEQWNGQPTDVTEITNRMKAQDDYLGDVWSKYFPTRTWTANSTIETIPMSVYNSIVAPDIIHTLTNFFNYMVNNGGINGVPRDPKKDYTFIANKDFGMNIARNYFRTYPDENQYTSTTAYSDNAIGMGTAMNSWKDKKAHELGHGLSVGDEAKQKNNNYETKIGEEQLNHNISVEDIHCLRDDDHPFGKNIPTEFFNPQTQEWTALDPDMVKTIMAAGTVNGRYAGLYTSELNDIIYDDNEYVYSTITMPNGNVYKIRVKASDLKNGTNNTINKTSDYVINTNPALMHSTPLNASELPVAPQISVTNNQLTITNINDYPEMVRGHKVRYFVYVYHKNNVQNNQYLNTNRPGGYPINETIDLSQFVGQNGVNDISDLAFTVFGDKVNSNSDETEMEVQNQAPEAPQNLAVSNITPNAAVANWSPATDPDGSVVGYKVELKKGSQTIVNTETTNTSFNFNNLDENTTYSLKVWSKDNEGAYSENFAETSFQTIEAPNQAPEAPQNLAVSNITPNSAVANWSPASDPDGSVVGYKVELKKGSQTIVNTETANTSFNFNGLAQNTNYTLKVWSKDNDGAYSENFAETSFQTPESANEPPTPPQNPEASNITATSATVSWQPASDPDGTIAKYEVYANGTLQGTVLPNQTLSMALTNLNPNATNAVQIVAFDNEGASAAANLSVETPKLPDTTPPNEMSENTFLKDVHAHRVVLTLAQAITDNASDPNQEVSGIDRVEIYIDGVYHSEIANPQVGDTQTVADLNPEQTYTFKYVATDNEGNQTEFEEEVTTDFDGIDENVAGIEVQAYPNPTTDKVKVNLPENAQVKNVMVYNLMGQVVKALETPYFSGGKQVLEIDMSGIAKGTYLLEIKTANTLFRGKLVKR